MRSLRTRLLLLIGSVVLVALVAAALFSQRTVRTEYQRLRIEGHRRTVSEAGERVRAWLLAGGDPASADSALRSIAGDEDATLILLGPDGAVLAATLPRAAGIRVRADTTGAVFIESEPAPGSKEPAMRQTLRGAPRIPIRDAAGRLRGTLLVLPSVTADLDRAGASPRFITSVNRGFVLAVLGAGALALLLALALSRRVLAPVEALTDAARRMERGDLAVRVPVRTKDEIGDLAHAFNAMADALATNEALRRNLVTDVAHELRTPLTNLRCQIEAIQDGLAPADAETIRSLHEETLLLGRLVDDLQTIALAEAGRLPLHRETVDVAAVVDSAVASVRARAAERGVTLGASSTTGLSADADPARLGQVLRNLLENALTHTPEGGDVTVEAAPADGAVRITVRDTGAGIAPEELPRVFERFYRADPARARATGGAGLGLAIVKHLVEAHGGRVAAASEPGRGAAFTITIPLATS